MLSLVSAFLFGSVAVQAVRDGKAGEVQRHNATAALVEEDPCGPLAAVEALEKWAKVEISSTSTVLEEVDQAVKIYMRLTEIIRVKAEMFTAYQFHQHGSAAGATSSSSAVKKPEPSSEDLSSGGFASSTEARQEDVLVMRALEEQIHASSQLSQEILSSLFKENGEVARKESYSLKSEDSEVSLADTVPLEEQDPVRTQIALDVALEAAKVQEAFMSGASSVSDDTSSSTTALPSSLPDSKSVPHIEDVQSQIAAGSEQQIASFVSKTGSENPVVEDNKLEIVKSAEQILSGVLDQASSEAKEIIGGMASLKDSQAASQQFKAETVSTRGEEDVRKQDEGSRQVEVASNLLSTEVSMVDSIVRGGVSVIDNFEKSDLSETKEAKKIQKEVEKETAELVMQNSGAAAVSQAVASAVSKNDDALKNVQPFMGDKTDVKGGKDSHMVTYSVREGTHIVDEQNAMNKGARIKEVEEMRTSLHFRTDKAELNNKDGLVDTTAHEIDGEIKERTDSGLGVVLCLHVGTTADARVNNRMITVEGKSKPFMQARQESFKTALKERIPGINIGGVFAHYNTTRFADVIMKVYKTERAEPECMDSDLANKPDGLPPLP